MNSAVRNNYATWKKWLMLGNKHHCCKTLGRHSQLKTHIRREKPYFLGQEKVADTDTYVHKLYVAF